MSVNEEIEKQTCYWCGCWTTDKRTPYCYHCGKEFGTYPENVEKLLKDQQLSLINKVDSLVTDLLIASNDFGSLEDAIKEKGVRWLSSELSKLRKEIE